MISVAKPYLPSLKRYNIYLKKIWKSNWLTNDGQLVQELEQKLKDYWKVKHVVCVSSGTSAIEIALKALNIKKEIYVSPFSFIATISAPLWIGIEPIFFNTEKEIKGPALITHTYGIPHLIKTKPVIYDASHAFAVKVNGKSILSYGDVSIISFHATKIFQTAEGGALVTNNNEIAKKARYMRNFGYKDQYSFQGDGINAKMSELHAAMGLCNLQNIDKIIVKYQKLVERYNQAFGTAYHDVSYYPLTCFSNPSKIIQTLNKQNIYPRRYFYPALNKVFGKQTCQYAEHLSDRVLCLPLYYELTYKEQDLVIKLIKEVGI